MESQREAEGMAVWRREEELHRLDAEIETTRRRLYAITNGLERVEDPARVANELEARIRQLGGLFEAAYRIWQAGERKLGDRLGD